MTLEEVLEKAAAALAAGDHAEAGRLARLVLSKLPYQPVALATLAAVAPAEEALGCYGRAVAHLDKVAQSTLVDHGLQVLRGRGFAPASILDVGAYDGRWTLGVLRHFPQARVLMVEPQQRMRPALDEVCRQHPNVSVRTILVGREDRAEVPFFQMETPFGSTGSSIYAEQTGFERHAVPMPMHRLDAVVAEAGGGPFQLVKLDVQGAELDVLAGAPGVVEAAELIVAEISVVDYNLGAPSAADVIAFLDARGFALFDLFPMARTPDGALLQTDALFLRKDSAFRPRPPF
ncbi:MAG: FkbM family methyltransferase [Actinomycetota bacterium]